MSKTVDERVVEMRFDNAQFERNVQTSMSTIDKLKQKLNFSGASKGLENINSEAKKVSFSNMESSLASLEKRFSTTGIIGMSVIHNLTTSAMNFVSKINSFVTGGIINGGITRAMNIQNARFQLKGLLKDGEAVEAVMKNVSDAVDGTAYSMDAAANVASQLAASGMQAGDEMFSALRAVAGVAAMTNSSYEDIGRIFTQVAGQGRLMGDQLLQLSSRGMNAAATLAKYLGKTEAEVREMTSKGQIDFQTFAAAMDDAFGEHAKEANKTFKGAMSNVKSALARIGELFVTPLIKSEGPLVNFFNALREKINVIKDNIGPFAEVVTGALTKMINGLTNLIKKLNIEKLFDTFSKISSKFSGLFKSNPLSKLAKKIDTVTKPAKKAAEAVKDFGDVVDKVINGDFGNGKARWEKLTEAGYDWAHIQNLVNEKLGDGTRHATNFKEAQEGLNKSQSVTVDHLAKMSDAQLKNLGFTESEIKAFRKLEEQSKKTGIPLQDLVNDIDRLGVKSLVLDSFKNIWSSIVGVFKSVGKAAKGAFKSIDSSVLYDIIAGFHKFTTKLKITDETADKITRTFKGLFAIIDTLTSIVGGGFKLAFKALSTVLGAFDIDILDLTANIGDALVKFRDFLFNNNVITKGFKALASGVKMAVAAIKSLCDTIGDLPIVQKILENIKNIDLTEVGKNIIAGLKNGLKDGITDIPKMLIEIGKALLSAIKGVLGIHSPSTEMYAVGQYSIEGLVNGIKDGTSKVWDAIAGIGAMIIEKIKSIDWPVVFAFGVSVALLAMVKRLIDIIDSVTAPLAGVGKILNSVAGVISTFSEGLKKILKSFSKNLNAKAFETRAKGIKELATALAILSASIYVLSNIDTKQLWISIGAIAVLSGILVALSFAMDKLNEASATIDKKSIKFKGFKAGLVQLGMTLLLIAATVKVMGTMDPDQMKQGFIGLAGAVTAIAAVFLAFGTFVKGKSAQNIDKAGKMIGKLSLTLLLLVGVVKLVGMLSTEEMIKGAEFAGAFVIFVTALNASSLIAGKNIEKLGKAILRIAIAMGLMVGVVKLSGQLSEDEIAKGVTFMTAFALFVGAIVAVTKLDKGSQIAKLSGLLMSISVSMMLMISVMKLVNTLSVAEVLKGVAFAAAFVLFVKAIVAVTKIGKDEQIAKVAATILALSFAIGVMAGVCILLSLIKLDALAKGVIAVGMLGTIMALMIHATKDAQNCKGNIIAMSVAIAVMATAVAALSFIDPSKLAGAVTALTIVMGMFALMSKAASSMQGVMGSLIVMTVAVGILAGIIYLLSTLPIESTLAAAASLSMLLLSLSAAMLVISNTGTIAPTALVAVGIMTAVVAALAGILYMLSGLPVESAIGSSIALSTLLITLSSCCVILNGASAVAPTALIAVGVMTLVTAALAGILYMLSGLPVESTLATAASLSILLLSLSACCAILAVVGMAGPAALIGVASLLALVVAVGGLMIAIGALTTYFPQLEEFLNNGMPILEKIGYALGSFVGNIVSGFANGIADGLPAIGLKLSLFMTALQPFLTGASSIDPAILEGVKSLAKAVLYLTAADVIQGITSFVTGGNSLVKFASQLKPFGEGLKDYADSVSGIDAESIKNSAKAAKALVSIANALPDEGGLLSKITGDNDLGTFASKLKPFGKGLKDYADSVSGIADVSVISTSAKAAKSLIGIAKLVPSEGGLLSKITGDNDLGTFASKLKPFGKGLKDYADSVSGIDTGTISSSISAAKSIIGLIKSTSGLDTSGVALFITAVNKLAKTNISGFVKAFDSAASKLESSGEKMMTSLAKGMENKKSSVTQKGEAIANAVQKAIKDKASKFETAGESLIKKLASGMKNQKSKVSDAATDGLKDAVSDIKGYYDDFYDAGGYLVKGFANGISDNTFRSTAKAKAMAKKAYEAAKEALDINSPSKIFRRLGKAVPEGFAQGIDRLGNVVENSSVSMARTAIDGTKDAIAHMAKIVDGDIDVQPTIRPVVDLSDVQSGVGALNGMFANELSIGANVDAKAISLMMNRNRQNGSNDEVISAINKLGKNIDNISRPSYTVEGITYDSGSEISAAVETLISAAIRERRV